MLFPKFSVLFASGLALSANAVSIHARHRGFHASRSQADSYAAVPSGYGAFDFAPSGYEPPSVHPTPSANSSCGCTTYMTTWYGEAKLVPAPAPTTYVTSISSEATSEAYVAPTSSETNHNPVSIGKHAEPKSSSNSNADITPTTHAASSTSEAMMPTPTAISSVYATAPVLKTSASPEAIATLYTPPVASESSSQWIPGSTSASLSATPSASSSGSSGSVAPNSNQWAMTYTPYANDGSCKTADQVSADVAGIASKGFTTVRLYATDCSGPINIGSACASHGLKMILGIYVDEAGIGSNTEEQIADLIEWGSGRWEMVEMVVAGNEAVFNGYITADELAGFVQDTKMRFRAAGYAGPVTTTEPLGTIQENADSICGAVDVIAANIHPFFNADVSAENAGEFVASQLSGLAKCCNNEKEAYNLETGWPTQGSPNGDAVPGYAEQKTAMEAILADAGAKSVLFSYTDDMWKSPGELGVEQHWGCSELFSG